MYGVKCFKNDLHLYLLPPSFPPSLSWPHIIFSTHAREPLKYKSDLIIFSITVPMVISSESRTSLRGNIFQYPPPPKKKPRHHEMGAICLGRERGWEVGSMNALADTSTV